MCSLAVSSRATLRTLQEGGFTIVYGFACFWLLPNSPTSIPLLSPHEKEQMARALHDDGIVLGDEPDVSYSLKEVGRSFLRPHVLLVSLAAFFSGKFNYLIRTYVNV